MTRLLLPTLLLMSVAPSPLGGQAPDSTVRTPEHHAFRAKLDWLMRDGGRWSADNPSFDANAEGSPRSFGYRFSQGWSADVVRLKITGRVGDTDYLYWDGFYYWHPVKNRGIYVAQGTGGAVASGEGVDGAGTLVFEVVDPDGSVSLHRDEDTRVSDDEFVSASFRYAAGEWTPNQRLRWLRVRQ